MYKKYYVFVILFLCSQPCNAYVDPGILSSLSQVFYALIFGSLSLFVLRPISFIKNIFFKNKCKFIFWTSFDKKNFNDKLTGKFCILINNSLYFLFDGKIILKEENNLIDKFYLENKIYLLRLEEGKIYELTEVRGLSGLVKKIIKSNKNLKKVSS